MKGDHIKIAHEIAFIIKWPQSKYFIIKVYNRVTSNHNMLHKNKKEVKKSGKVASTVSLRFHLSSQFYRGTRLKEFQFWRSSKTSNFKQHLRFVYNVSMFDSFNTILWDMYLILYDSIFTWVLTDSRGSIRWIKQLLIQQYHWNELLTHVYTALLFFHFILITGVFRAKGLLNKRVVIACTGESQKEALFLNSIFLDVVRSYKHNHTTVIIYNNYHIFDF